MYKPTNTRADCVSINSFSLSGMLYVRNWVRMSLLQLKKSWTQMK